MMTSINALLAGVISARRSAAPAGTLKWGASFDPVYTEHSVTTEYFGLSGNVQRQATAGPFGNPCAILGSGGATGFPGLIYSASPANLSLGSQNFTIECWVRFSGTPGSNVHFISHWSNLSSTRTWTLRYNAGFNRVEFEHRLASGGTTQTARFFSPNIFSGSWHHIAAERVGSTVTVYIDGAAGAVTSNPGTQAFFDPPGTSSRPAIGCFVENLPNSSMSGQITECRITRGVARYGASFTRPSAVFPRGASNDSNWSNVLLLVGFNGTWGYRFGGDQPRSAADLIFSQTTGSTSNLGHVEANGATAFGYTGLGHIGYTADTALDVGSQDFTVEGTFFTGNLTGFSAAPFFGFYQSSGKSIFFRFNNVGANGLQAVVSTDGSADTHVLAGTYPNSGVFHVALNRSGNTLTLYVNGTLASSTTISGAVFAANGRRMDIVNRDLSVLCQGFRFVYGASLYSGGTLVVPNRSNYPNSL